jgi:nitrile hydratase accessory protein
MPKDLHARDDALKALEVLPAGERTPTFNEPWEAQAFAIAVTLQRNGVFTKEEWAMTLGEEIKKAQQLGDPDTGTTYYRHWLAAVEHLVQSKGIANEKKLLQYQEAWHKAADRTPHGQPIVLAPEDLN